MGLRDESAHINDEAYRRQVEANAKALAHVTDFLPGAMADWAGELGLDTVPNYTVTRTKLSCDAAQAHIEFTEDGMDFTGVAESYEGGAPSFIVIVQGPLNFVVRSVDDIARALAQWEAIRNR